MKIIEGFKVYTIEIEEGDSYSEKQIMKNAIYQAIAIIGATRRL